MKRVFVVMSVAAFVFLGTIGEVSAQQGSGQDFVILLDKFMVDGPGALNPGWFDDFDDGDLGGWMFWGTCQDVPGTSYARLESPGGVIDYADIPGVSYEESSLLSWIIPGSYVSADGPFQGIATFAAQLPQPNESISLALFYGPFDLDGNGTLMYEIIQVFIENTTPTIAAIFGNPVTGLQVQQGRAVLDENWNPMDYTNWDSEQVIVPGSLGDVILSIRYHDDANNPVFRTGYSISVAPEVLEPFSPIPSNLHLCDFSGIWGIGAHVDFLNGDIDIKPGSDRNAVNCTNENGVIPVAILSGPEFDATTVDHTSVSFEGAGELHASPTGELLRHEKDVDDDGDLDLVFHFELGSTSLTCISSEGVLIGETYDGSRVSGRDSLQMVGGLRFRKPDLRDAVFVIEDDDGINILKLAGDGEFSLWYQEFDPHAVGEASGAWAVDSSGNLVIDWIDTEEDTLLTLLVDAESFMDVMVWGGDETEIVRLEKVIPFDASTLPGNYYATREYDPAWYAMATVNTDGTGTATDSGGTIWSFWWSVDADGRLDMEFYDPAPALNHDYLLAASAAGTPYYVAGMAIGPGGVEEVFLETWWLQP